MKKISPASISDNLIDIIGREWMLVTAGTPDHFNAMTANWGEVGFLWNKPVVTIFIRPERYTFEFIEKNDYFTLSFLGEQNREIHKICGSKSGRDIDKIKETGLHPSVTELGNVIYAESRLSIECRKLYKDVIRKENFLDTSIFEKWYTVSGNPHYMYVAEVVNVWLEE